MQKLLFAYKAVRHHPVFKVNPSGAMIHRDTMTTPPAVPLEDVPAGADWDTILPGLRIHANAQLATQVARGELSVDTLSPRVLRATAEQAADLGSETPGSEPEDHGQAADGVAPEVPDLTLQNYEEATAPQLLA